MKLRNAIGTLHEKGVDEFYTDCDYGFPLWGAKHIISLMRDNDIRLYVVFPHENQMFSYAEDWRDDFFFVHEHCTDVIPMFQDSDVDGNIIFSRLSEKELVRKAHDFMLDDCKRLIYCGTPRGYIYEQAVIRGYEITHINI